MRAPASSRSTPSLATTLLERPPPPVFAPACPRHRRPVDPDAIPTTYALRPPLAWLDVVPPPSGRYQPRHRRPLDRTL